MLPVRLLPQVIISGEATQVDPLLNAAHAAWAPDNALILIDPTSPDSVGFWKAHNPEAWAMVDAHYSKQQKQAPSSSHGGAATVAEPACAADSMVADMGLQPKEGAVAAAAGGAGSSMFPPTAFVCQNFTCQAPTGDAGKVYDLLSQQSAGVVKLQPVKL